MFLDNELLLTVIYYKTFQQVQSSGGTTGERGPLHGVKSRKTGNCLYKVVKTDEFLKILAPENLSWGGGGGVGGGGGGVMGVGVGGCGVWGVG